VRCVRRLLCEVCEETAAVWCEESVVRVMRKRYLNQWRQATMTAARCDSGLAVWVASDLIAIVAQALWAPVQMGER
jgi:hypothetical protein